MPLCNHCKNGIIDNEYELQMHGQPLLTDALLCGNDILKDLYYNRNAKTKSARVNSFDQPPILVGNAYGYCRGKFYNDCGHSILESEDDFEKTLYNEDESNLDRVYKKLNLNE